MGLPFLLDAVLFDLDGTLVATDRFWIPAARTGARRVWRELGIEAEIPTAEQWMGVVGRPLEEGFRDLFPDFSERVRERVLAACREEEHRLLREGALALMPGARETLEAFHAAGVAIGVASNCSQPYLDHMLGEAGLGRWAGEARCLDSPGVATKADMIADLLESFGTRSALMVGDRAGDRDAAWANGIPHAHCAFGFAGRHEDVEAEARICDLGALVGLVASRRERIAEVLGRAGLFRASARPPLVVGVCGAPAVGKTLFARDAARVLSDRGRPARAVGLCAFPARGEVEEDGAEGDPIGTRFDLARLHAELLEPYARGESVQLRSSPGDRPGAAQEEVELRPDEILILEGPGLLDPRLRPRIDRVLHLEAPEEILLRRVAGRDGRHLGLAPLEIVRARRIPAWRARAARYDPDLLADVRVDVSNPLLPAPLPPASSGPPSEPSREPTHPPPSPP